MPRSAHHRPSVAPALVTAAAVLATFAVCLIATAAPAHAVRAKQWTVMLYLDGENGDMQNDVLAEFDAMIAARVGSGAAVNVVAQLDRIPGSDKYGGWTEANRFYVAPGMEPTEANAVPDWGDGRGGREVDTADPAVLRDFVRWAVARYPARRYALVILDHGYGWKGLCIDETSLGASMSVKELAGALRGLPCTLDLLDLDACLMNSAEVGYELHACDVDVVVGSEAPGTTWPLTRIIAIIAADPAIATETLARRTCDLYFEAHPGEEDITLAAYRLSGMAPLASAVKALGDGLATPPHEDVSRQARGVLDALEATVLSSRAGSDLADAHGLSIYYPDFEGPYHSSIPEDFLYFYQTQVTSFGEDAGWQGLLWRYYTHADGLDARVYHARSGVLTIEDTVDLSHLCRLILGTPTTAASGCGGGWHNAPVDVTFTALPIEAAIPVASTEYRLDGGAWTTGAALTVPAPSDHSWDGEHTVGYRSTDTASPANVEAEQTGTVRIDTTRPVTTALSGAVVKRGRVVTLRYRVDDALPSGVTLSPHAKVTILIKTTAGKTVKRLSLGRRGTNAPRRYRWRCTLRRGAYRWVVRATDLAGNRQSGAKGARLVVR